MKDVRDDAAVHDANVPAVKARAASRGRTAKLGRFELIEPVGAGAFGTVFRGWDPQLERQVAVKVPRTGMLVDEDDVTRFLREAKAAAQLRHPHIVAVYEAGLTERTYYIVSDFVQGTSLKEELNAGRRFAHKEAARLISQIAQALHYAHTKGVVHRDVKPANVMLDEAGEPRIMDFGLARRSEGDALQTREGAVMGTPAYMSPEQAQGKSHLADARSDVWALGVMFFELLTGTRPFHGSESELLIAVRIKEPDPPRKIAPSIPKDLETICLKCLAKNPDERFPSAQELADELERWQRGEPILARPIGATERLWRWAKREPVASGLSFAAALLLVGAAATSVLAAMHFARARNEIDARRGRVEQQKQIAERKTRDAEEQQFDATLQTRLAQESEKQAEEELLELEKAETKRLQSVTRAQSEEQLQAKAARDVEAEMSRLEEAKKESTTAAEDKEKAQKVLEAGRWSIERYAGLIAGAAQHQASGQKELAQQMLARCPAQFRSWEWSYLNRVVLSENDKPVVLHSERDIEPPRIAFSSDSQMLVLLTGQTIELWSSSTGDRERVTDFASLWNDTAGPQAAKAKAREFGFLAEASPDGKHFVVAHPQKGIKVCNRLGQTVASMAIPKLEKGNAIRCVAISGDGSHIAVGAACRSSTTAPIAVGRLATQNWLGAMLGHESGSDSAPVANDAQLLQRLRSEAARRAHDELGLNLASNSHALLNLTTIWFPQFQYVSWVSRIVLSPDGSWLCSNGSDGQIKWWNVKTGQQAPPLAIGLWPLAFSADGQRAACLTPGGIEFWDIVTGKRLVAVDGRTAAVSPDGKRLVTTPEKKGQVVFWDTESGRKLYTLDVGEVPIVRLVFSLDGNKLATLDSGGAIQIWNAAGH